MWIFLLPEASKICEGLTAKWPLWDDLIQSPAGFQHFLWSSEAAFYFIVHILFWGTERVTHQTRRQLRNGKSNKDTAQNSLESHFNHITVERCSLYFGDFFFFFLSLTQDFTCPMNPTVLQDSSQAGQYSPDASVHVWTPAGQPADMPSAQHSWVLGHDKTNEEISARRGREAGGKNKPAQKGRHTKMPAKRYDIHMQNSNKSSHVKTGVVFSPQYLLF